MDLTVVPNSLVRFNDDRVPLTSKYVQRIDDKWLMFISIRFDDSEGVPVNRHGEVCLTRHIYKPESDKQF
jgi:hypothetical protein